MLETKIFIIQVKIFSAVGCKVNHKYRQHHYCKHRDWRCCGHGSVSRCHFYYFLFVSLINRPIQIKPTSRTNVVVKVLEEGPEYHVIHISGDQRFICFLQCWPADVVSIRWSARVTGLGHPTACSTSVVIRAQRSEHVHATRSNHTSWVITNIIKYLSVFPVIIIRYRLTRVTSVNAWCVRRNINFVSDHLVTRCKVRTQFAMLGYIQYIICYHGLTPALMQQSKMFRLIQ